MLHFVVAKSSYLFRTSPQARVGVQGDRSYRACLIASHLIQVADTIYVIAVKVRHAVHYCAIKTFCHPVQSRRNHVTLQYAINASRNRRSKYPPQLRTASPTRPSNLRNSQSARVSSWLGELLSHPYIYRRRVQSL